MRRPSNRRALVVACFAIACACALIGWYFRSPPPVENADPVTILSGPFAIPDNPRDRFALTFAKGGRWAERAENLIFGKRAPIDITTELIDLPGAVLTNLQSLLTGVEPAYTSSNGVSIWFLSTESLNQSARKISQSPGAKTFATPRMVSADGLGSSVFMGQSIRIDNNMTDVGLSLRCAATIRGDVTELFTTITYSDMRPATNVTVSVQTNMNLSVRLNVPAKKGVLLVTPSAIDPTNGLALVIQPLR